MTLNHYNKISCFKLPPLQNLSNRLQCVTNSEIKQKFNKLQCVLVFLWAHKAWYVGFLHYLWMCWHAFMTLNYFKVKIMLCTILNYITQTKSLSICKTKWLIPIKHISIELAEYTLLRAFSNELTHSCTSNLSVNVPFPRRKVEHQMGSTHEPDSFLTGLDIGQTHSS